MSPGLTAIFATGLAKRPLRPPNLESRLGLGAAFYGRGPPPLANGRLQLEKSTLHDPHTIRVLTPTTSRLPLSFFPFFPSPLSFLATIKAFCKTVDIAEFRYGIYDPRPTFQRHICCAEYIIFPPFAKQEGNFARSNTLAERRNMQVFFRVILWKIILRPLGII